MYFTSVGCPATSHFVHLVSEISRHVKVMEILQAMPRSNARLHRSYIACRQKAGAGEAIQNGNIDAAKLIRATCLFVFGSGAANVRSGILQFIASNNQTQAATLCFRVSQHSALHGVPIVRCLGASRGWYPHAAGQRVSASDSRLSSWDRRFFSPASYLAGRASVCWRVLLAGPAKRTSGWYLLNEIIYVIGGRAAHRRRCVRRGRALRNHLSTATGDHSLRTPRNQVAAPAFDNRGVHRPHDIGLNRPRMQATLT